MTTSSKSSVAEQTIEILIESERLADSILMNKQEIISLDKRRQENREALRIIEKGNEKKVWITIGTILVKMSHDKAVELLKKDQVQIDSEINKLRSEQKLLVTKHRDVEHSSPLRGFDLKPMSTKDMSAIRDNFPLGY